MGGLVGEFLYPCDEIFVHVVAAEFSDEFVIVDLFSGGVGDHVWVDNDIILLRFLLMS